jgi:nucleotide-binding universal stress UspA family protein
MPTAELEKSTTFNNIVVATDFSVASRRAVLCASFIAEDDHARLFVLHATPPAAQLPVLLNPLPFRLDLDLVKAEEHFADLATSEWFHHLQHKEILAHGDVCAAVADVLERHQGDLLVLGTRRKRGSRGLALGSVAERLFRSTACPVMTLGPSNLPPRQIKRVLYATDFGPSSISALPNAIDFANRSEGELILLHLVPPISAEYVGPAWYPTNDVIEREERDKRELLPKLQSLLPSNSGLRCKVEYVVEVRYAAEGIINVAKEREVDLIVMGVRQSGMGAPRLGAHMPWAVAYEVVCRAECPVLTVRA